MICKKLDLVCTFSVYVLKFYDLEFESDLVQEHAILIHGAV